MNEAKFCYILFLTYFVFSTIYQLLRKLENEKDIVIFKGSGPVFCAGGDVKQIAGAPKSGVILGYTNGYRSTNLIANYKKPYVALMDGLAFGGAAYYSIPGKRCVATERTTFAMPETAIGYFNDSGSTYFLPRLKANFGIYMGLTGAHVKGFDVKKVGLATDYVESHKLDELESELITTKTNEDVGKILKKFSSDPISNATELDNVLPKVKKCFSSETMEEIYDNLQEDGSEWAQNTLKVLNRMSPISLKVVHKSLKIAKTLSLQDCLKMEFRLAIHHNTKSDLREGARAVLIEKDFKPKWSRKSIYDVTDEDVERFFQQLPDEEELSL